MNAEQFSLLVHQHTAAMNTFALKFTRDADDAKDLMQDTMMKALRYFNRYEQGTNLKAWLFTIMKNTFINNYRKDVRINALIVQNDTITSAQLMKSCSKNHSENKFMMGDIQGAIGSLPAIYSTPFVRYVEGYKYEEISAELRIPIGTVKTRIHMARKELKKKLQLYREGLN